MLWPLIHWICLCNVPCYHLHLAFSVSKLCSTIIGNFSNWFWDSKMTFLFSETFLFCLNLCISERKAMLYPMMVLEAIGVYMAAFSEQIEVLGCSLEPPNLSARPESLRPFALGNSYEYMFIGSCYQMLYWERFEGVWWLVLVLSETSSWGRRTDADVQKLTYRVSKTFLLLK